MNDEEIDKEIIDRAHAELRAIGLGQLKIAERVDRGHAGMRHSWRLLADVETMRMPTDLVTLACARCGARLFVPCPESAMSESCDDSVVRGIMGS